MKIYTFNKSFQERVDEFNFILEEEENGDSIKDLFRDFLETTIEPAYYKAIWKVSKQMCEELKISFPVEIFGEVQQTNFEELTVDFKIEQVQDDSIELPEVCQVPLDEIYPTVYQEYSTLNVDTTADYLDRYRFFFNFIFLPFDSENGKNFATVTMIPRVKLFYDLKNKRLSKSMASYIRKIIAEVKYIQYKRDQLTASIKDGETDGSRKETIAKLLDLHLRMNKIKLEIEILVNPDMREAYEITKFGRKKEDSKQTYVVTVTSTLTEQIKLLEQLKAKISSQTAINWILSLSDAVANATNESEIFLPCGRHSFNFLEYLNGNLLICGSQDIEKSDGGDKAIIYAEEDASMLFVIDGDMRFENVLIDCRNVKTAFLIKNGTVVLKNCKIIGSTESSIGECVSASGESLIILDKCVISNFLTAFNISEMTRLELNNCMIEKCNIGIAINDNVKVQMTSSVLNANDCGIMKYTENVKDSMSLTMSDKKELDKFNLHIYDNDNKIEAAIKVTSKFVEEDIQIEIEDESEEQHDIQMENM